jgi:DNA (cytosine-5)-methyltransferase 1
MRTLWFAEQNDYCRRVLARHWPGVPCHPDVRALGADTSGARRRQDVRGAHGDEGADARRGSQDADQPDGRDEGGGAGPVLPVPVPYVDVLCGGFPCQDLSYAGKGAGIDGERSGLWSEYARLIRELRPRYVVVENVPALLGRGLGRVLGDLAACGYDAEWDCLPASAFGAPHRRDRVWLVAYPYADGGRRQVIGIAESAGVEHGGYVADGLRQARPGEDQAAVADPSRDAEAGPAPQAGAERERVGAGGQPSGAPVADAEGTAIGTGLREDEPRGVGRGRPGDGSGSWNAWATEPDVGRVAHGIPARVDRLAALGNALVPAIAQWIGERILEYEEGRLAA